MPYLSYQDSVDHGQEVLPAGPGIWEEHHHSLHHNVLGQLPHHWVSAFRVQEPTQVN